MKRTLICLAVAGLGMIPGLARADTDTVTVDTGHTATVAKAGSGATRDLLTLEEILAMVAKSKPASLTAPAPEEVPPVK